MASGKMSLQEQKRVLTNNHKFIVDNLDADDVIDELVQEKLIGRNAAQRVHVMGMSRMDKNRIIVDQLSIAGPGTLEKFCEILRRNKRQSFIAEELGKKSCNIITLLCHFYQEFHIIKFLFVLYMWPFNY